MSAEWCDQRRTPILTTSFDPTALDTLTECVIEEIEAGRDPTDVILEYVYHRVTEAKCDLLRKVMDLMIYADKPRLEAIAIADVSGMFTGTEMSGPDRAGEHSVSKQAYQQRCERVRESLEMRKTRNNRDEVAKTKFSNRNFRRSSLK